MTRFVISPEQSQMWIEARSNVHPIHTSTYGVGGHLDVVVGSDGRVDVAANPSGELSLAVDRLRSGNRLEDRELHRRIDSGRFPNIVGVLKTMEASGVHGTYKVGGDITFRGVSREPRGSDGHHPFGRALPPAGGEVPIRHPRLRNGSTLAC